MALVALRFLIQLPAVAWVPALLTVGLNFPAVAWVPASSPSQSTSFYYDRRGTRTVNSFSVVALMASVELLPLPHRRGSL